MFESIPPPKISPELQWSFLQPANGDHIDVRWIGPIHGLITHHAGVTKPCRAELTGGALACKLCEAKMAKRWRGYAPAITFQARRVVFLLGAEAASTLTSIDPGTCLTFSRGKTQTAPVIAQRYNGLAARVTNASFLPGGPWHRGVVLWPWLCKLWCDQELADLLQKHHHAQ